MNSKIVSILLAGTFLLSSCNKEEDIIDDEGGKTMPQEASFRPATDTSSATANKVFDYTPAPGQFINEGNMSDITSAADACQWAQARLGAGQYVSLGGFGGYIVVGFDHSIPATDTATDYDFGIAGNALLNSASGRGGSNEPGIVFVMQDTNGNGLPDDTWYELRGSNTGQEGTLSGYAVTYYRPDAPASAVRWTDNLGGSGQLEYVAAFHSQDYYYPAWIEADSYTLRGTCLPSRSSLDAATGYWNNEPFAWGYADNRGSDSSSLPGVGQLNRFRIADAITATGADASLSFIDFVKVQTGVNATAGALGEISTEVLGFYDLHME